MKHFGWILRVACLLATPGIFASGVDCPDRLTKLEQDGLTAVQPAGEARFQQLKKCGKAELLAKFPQVDTVKLKSKKCECHSGNWEGYERISIANSYQFIISESEPREDCRLGSHFIVCQKPGPCYQPPKSSECSMPKYNNLACPKQCLTWVEQN